MLTEVKVIGESISQEETQAYIDYLEEKNGRKLASLTIETDGDFVNLNYKLSSVPFERIRRITGYLVGTMDRWNDAKTAEEADRVKHSTSAQSIEKVG
ncbi:MAG: anaerobic ribonucleoside-triphosphate reductase [Bacillota bacterium]|nr:anaerobic ribonucleoside-triphosphate reductase [Bacillota bacterium]